MEQTHDQDSFPAAETIDKSRVLNVKPLRSLAPVFSSGGSAPRGSNPSVCVSPSGPFPPGVAPFYPFVGAPGSQGTSNAAKQYTTPISAAVPLSSFRTDSLSSNRGSKSSARSQASGGVSEEDGSGEDASDMEGEKTRSRKKSKVSRFGAIPEVDGVQILDNILASYNIKQIDSIRLADGNNETIGNVLFVYDLLRRKITQMEDKIGSQGLARRPDLKASSIMVKKEFRTNNKKRIGTVHGVEVGDIFFFRIEMCVIGLHSQVMAGIDYIGGGKANPEEEPLAVSIVSSGGYENNADDENVLIYSGQGGNNSKDQTLERGNLALERSLHRGTEVRVIRGTWDTANPNAPAKQRVYFYDGLYKLQESWVEKGKSGCNVFMYKLFRLSGQPDAFKTWKLIQQWKDGFVPRAGMILPDLTSGAERLPVSLVNNFDDEKGPAYFTYSSSLSYSKHVNAVEPYIGCTCSGGCLPTKRNCSCIKKNEGALPYIVNGILVEQKPLIYECGSSCQCPFDCKNRLTQGGLTVRLEVFKTKDKGWGLRSWDPIRANAFICEYAGEVISPSDLQRPGEENIGGYFLDATRTYKPMDWMPSYSNSSPHLPFPLAISAKNSGNVARFMNHSCSPNVFWQPVSRANNKEFDLHIAFFAIRHIPPMKELTFNYGTPEKGVRKKCLCRSSKCKGFFY